MITQSLRESIIDLLRKMDGLCLDNEEERSRLCDAIISCFEYFNGEETANLRIGIERAEARVKELEERLQFDPGGSDKIDELEMANQFMRHSCDCAEAELARLRPVYKAAVAWYDTEIPYIPDETDHGIARARLRAAVEKAEDGAP